MNIEPGCLAVTYNCYCPENNGKTVKVGRFLERPPPPNPFNDFADSRWEVDIPMVCRRYKADVGIFCNHLPEHNLLRIDGFEETEDELQEIEV